VGDFQPDDEIVIHCKSGMRSGKACAFLREHGFQNVRNVVGGILAWSDQIDPTVPKY
jgi:adenylyltransferase/sulfurtransferase